MQEQKILSKAKERKHQDLYGKDDTPKSATGSFRSLTGSFTKQRRKTSQTSASEEQYLITSHSDENDAENGFLHNLEFNKHDTRDLEKMEKQIYRIYKKKVKYWSYFVVSISAYILLNACIGYSSAPFYIKDIQCYIFDPTPHCRALEGQVSWLYGTDMLTGFTLLFIGMIGLYFIDRDNIRNMTVAHFLKKSCRVVLVMIIVLLILRIYFFVMVQNAIGLIA